MLKSIKTGGYMAFTIRDIYIDAATDNGQAYKPTFDKLCEEGKMEQVHHCRYTKYKGLQFGSGHQEEGANIYMFRKL